MAALWPPPPDHQPSDHPLPDNRQISHPIMDQSLPHQPTPSQPLPNHQLLDNRQLDNRLSDNRQLHNRIPDNRLPDNRHPDNRHPDNRHPDIRHPDNRHPDNRLANHPIPDHSLLDQSLQNHPLPSQPFQNHPLRDNRLPDNRLPDNRLPDHRLPDNRLANHPIPDHSLPDHHLQNHQLRDNRLSESRLPDNRLPSHPLPDHSLPDHPLQNNLLPNYAEPNHPIQNLPPPNRPVPDSSLPQHPIPDHRLPENQQPNQPLEHPRPNPPSVLLQYPGPNNDPDYGPLDCSIPPPTINADNQPQAAHADAPPMDDDAPPMDDDAPPMDEDITPSAAPLHSDSARVDADNQLEAKQKDGDNSAQPHTAAGGSDGESFPAAVKEEVAPPLINCFVCDTSSPKTTTFLNIFQSDTAIREQLKERLEGVLAVTLEEEQAAGPHVCNGCSQTLENIECLAAGLRAAFTTTEHAHCSRRNGFDQDMNYTGESKTPLRNLTSNSQRIKLRVRHFDERGKYRENSQTDEGDDSEGDYGETSDVPAPKQAAPRKRKNAKPQRVIREDNGISSDEVDLAEPYNADTDDQKDVDFVPDEEDNYKPVVVIRKKRPHRQRVQIIDSDDPGDDDFNPKESYQPVVKAKRPGRPKGSKTKKKKTPGSTANKPPSTPREKDQGGVCETCQKAFSSNYKLNRHRLSHSDQRPFKCPQCTHQFKAKYHLDRHLQIHSGVKPHVCPDCGSGFREKHQLAEHQLTHTGERPHACTQCDQRFQKTSALKVHMYDHTGEWPFKCAVCNVGFVREAELKDHVTIHTGEKPFKCQQCGAAFRLASTLKVHMRRHSGVKPYICQLCGGRYAAANTLKEHLRTHAGERKFLCHTCGAAFVHQSGLVQHAKTHLAIEDRKHVCPYCQRRFNELALLKRHQRIHTNERPYMCSKCGKAFRRPGELSMHYRYHSNDRRYVCITCNKSFFTRSHLKRHQATHNSTFMSGAGHSGGTLQPQPKSAPLTLHPPGQQSPRRYPHEGDYQPPEGLHVCMICSKQFRHIEQLTKHISRIHNPNMPMDEHMTSVAAIEDYSHAYSAEELGLPYMNPMHMMPPMPQ